MENTLQEVDLPVDETADIRAFVQATAHVIDNHLERAASEHGAVKFCVSIGTEFERASEVGIWRSNGGFRGEPMLYGNYDVNHIVHVDHYNSCGSSWQITKITECRYRPLDGSSFIPLPKFIADTRSRLNVKSKDNMCLLWSILSALHPAPFDLERVSHYKAYLNELCIDNITFPVPGTQIADFEKMNQSISANIYGLQGMKFFHCISAHIPTANMAFTCCCCKKRENDIAFSLGISAPLCVFGRKTNTSLYYRVSLRSSTHVSV